MTRRPSRYTRPRHGAAPSQPQRGIDFGCAASNPDAEARGGPDTKAEGILVYPAVERALNLRYQIQGHGLSIRTLDLAAPWPEIHGELISLLQERPATLLPDVATADPYQGTIEDHTG